MDYHGVTMKKLLILSLIVLFFVPCQVSGFGKPFPVQHHYSAWDDFLFRAFSCHSCYAQVWEEKTDTTYWEAATYGSWSGTAWNSGTFDGHPFIQISNASTWNIGYRPKYIKITFTGTTTINFNLQSLDGMEEVTVTGMTSGQVVTSPFSDYDMFLLTISGPIPEQAFQVTKIEFGYQWHLPFLR
jgi:hypothetical protein